MSNRKMWCSRHDVALHRTQTRYGGRWSCPALGCTVVAWEGQTSTPADQETRDARRAAHDAFDPLWRSGRMRRREAYARLAKFLGISKARCHIGMFGLDRCKQVLKFVQTEKGGSGVKSR